MEQEYLLDFVYKGVFVLVLFHVGALVSFHFECVKIEIDFPLKCFTCTVHIGISVENCKKYFHFLESQWSIKNFLQT